MYKVYVLSSQICERFYVGYTDNLAIRLKSHNSGKVKSTKPYRLWNVVYTEEFGNKKEAFCENVK